MKKAGVLVFLCSICSILFAQSTQVKFGNVTFDELAMQSYDKDSSAEAVILYDYCNVYYEYAKGEYVIVKEVRQRIKLLSDDRNEYDEFTIKLRKGEVFSANEDLKEWNAYLYTLKEEEIQKKKLAIERDKFIQRLVEPTINYTINLAELKKGAIVEIEYTTQTPFSLSNIPEKKYFQHTIPMVKSEYLITIPEWFHYKLIVTNNPTFTIDEKYSTDVKLNDFKRKGTVYHLVAENIPAFKVEPYMPLFTNYLPGLSFDYLETKPIYYGNAIVNVSNLEFNAWEDIDTYFLQLDSFGGQLNLPHLFEKEVPLFTPIEDSLKRAEAIYNYIKSTYKFYQRSHEIKEGLVKISDLSRLKTSKYGNSASINLLLLNLLKASGISAYPILLSAGNNGWLSEQTPILSNLNYLLIGIQLNDKLIYADASNEYLPFGMVSENFLNRLGRLIDTKESRFVYLENENRNTTVVDIKAELSRNLIKGYCEIKENGYKAFEIQKGIREACQDTTFINNYKKAYIDWNCSDFEIKNSNYPDVRTTIRYNFLKTMRATNDSLIIQPLFFSPITDNPFFEKERKYPVDFKTKASYSYVAQLKLPQDVSILKLPSPVAFVLPNNGGRLNYTINYNEADNTLSIVYLVALLKPIYEVEEYPFLKEFYDKMSRIHSEQIVLKAK